jgi:hypothetical protein
MCMGRFSERTVCMRGFVISGTCHSDFLLMRGICDYLYNLDQAFVGILGTAAKPLGQATNATLCKGSSLPSPLLLLATVL